MNKYRVFFHNPFLKFDDSMIVRADSRGEAEGMVMAFFSSHGAEVTSNVEAFEIKED